MNIDTMFRKLFAGATSLRPKVALQFAYRAHSAYLAAVGLIMAGQIYEAQALMRLCLEHGAYGFYIGANNDRWNIWQNRSSSQDARKACVNEFRAAKVKAYIEANAPHYAQLYGWLYEQLIDFGAHPNEAGIAMSSAIYRDGEDIHWSTLYLQGDGEPLDYGLKTVARVGLWVLYIMKQLYPEHFEKSGLAAELKEEGSRVR